MNYPESVQFLYALGNEVKTIKLGLEPHPHRTRRTCAIPNEPTKSSTWPAPTAKAPCARMIDAGLRAANVRTGMFTSPHLIEPTERIQIDGMPVSREEFEQAFNAVHEAANKLDLDAHPTYFETVTAMALWLFRERGVEMAVVEVGAGRSLERN